MINNNSSAECLPVVVYSAFSVGEITPILGVVASLRCGSSTKTDRRTTRTLGALSNSPERNRGAVSEDAASSRSFIPVRVRICLSLRSPSTICRPLRAVPLSELEHCSASTVRLAHLDGSDRGARPLPRRCVQSVDPAACPSVLFG